MRAYPEHLLDLADAAHAARVAGYSEAQIARAAGFPPPEPHLTREATPDEIIARILHQDPKTLHPSDLEWWRVTVNQVLTYRDHP